MTQTIRHRAHERGMALAIVLASSVIFSIAAFGVMTLALSRAEHGEAVGNRRMRAHYAAEAGLVQARQKLWADPDYPNPCCGGPCVGKSKTDTWKVDTDMDGKAETLVTITVDECGATFNKGKHRLSAKVNY